MQTWIIIRQHNRSGMSDLEWSTRMTIDGHRMRRLRQMPIDGNRIQCHLPHRPQTPQSTSVRSESRPGNRLRAGLRIRRSRLSVCKSFHPFSINIVMSYPTRKDLRRIDHVTYAGWRPRAGITWSSKLARMQVTATERATGATTARSQTQYDVCQCDILSVGRSIGRWVGRYIPTKTPDL